MKVYLDDVRRLPADFNLLVKTEAEAIETLDRMGDNIDEISLDCDLGDPFDDVDFEKIDPGCGYNVAKWIVEQWAQGRLLHLEVRCHSANQVERRVVLALIQVNEERFKHA